ncbi:1-phosphatidylinositol 4,5-bisphosphate phosphodiesterase delta-4 [Hypsibius exemplaris]|uniref:Phosphoinositide phospholipase C n=1 Tax=Hypsibius exemplaris TaxID=2072580 RepID=A0A1W0WQJ1_HYPEX|nr:1-phosphatidylinositol 4,5-bisphosphate phosphodiesterase delta-4 [Hypsibius exemplaris]
MTNLLEAGRSVLRSLSFGGAKHRRTIPESAVTINGQNTSLEMENGTQIEQIEFDKAVQVLLKGETLIKVTVHNKLYSRFYRLDPDCQTLHYHDPVRRYGSCQAKSRPIDLLSLKEVRMGYKTDVFNACSKSRSFTARISADRCFSLILPNGESLNLIAPTSESRKEWANVIQHIIGKGQQEDRETRMEKWLRKQFKQADTSGDGFLNFDECMLLLDHLNLHFSKEQAAEIFKKAGTVTRRQASGEALELPHQQEVLNAEGFRRFYALLSERGDLQKIFTEFAEGDHQTWTTKTLQKFLREVQHEEDQTLEACEFIIKSFEPMDENQSQNLLGLAGFRNYLLNQRQFLFHYKNRQVFHNMTHPLKDYFIASSHNTYLTSNQLTGVSSVEAYISCLLTGCRCVELDCWDGDDGEPVITHGHTLTSKILFRDVLTTIRDYGFKASPYPVILSIENHCSVEQQHVMAAHLTSILGESIYNMSSINTNSAALPSPEDLKGRVILKGKKLKAGISKQSSEEDDDMAQTGIDGAVVEEGTGTSMQPKQLENLKTKTSEAFSKEVFLGAVKFRSFKQSKETGHHSEMSSLSEAKFTELSKTGRHALLAHTRHQLVRIYPGGLRTDSSNYNPLPMLHAGCQIVALNYQDRKPETQIYKAMFKDNGGCGYLLKPSYMREHDIDELDKHDENRQPVSMRITVISAQQLPKPEGIDDEDISDPYVTVQIFGSSRDCNKQATTYVRNNGFNPVWNQALVFLIYEPEIAVLRFEIKDYDRRSTDETIGHYSIPVNCLQLGYRHVELFDKHDVNLEPSTLFVNVERRHL